MKINFYEVQSNLLLPYLILSGIVNLFCCVAFKTDTWINITLKIAFQILTFACLFILMVMFNK